MTGSDSMFAGSHLEKVLRLFGNAIGALWIAGGMLFFLIRFSSIFYYSNQSALDSLLSRLQ